MRSSLAMKTGMSIALLATLLVTGATPAFGATPTSTSVDQSLGVTTHTSKVAMSKAECDAIHQPYPKAECVIVVTETISEKKVARSTEPNTVQIKPDTGSISPNLYVDDSPCPWGTYYAGTAQYQEVALGGAWSFTTWFQYERDASCGYVEYQVVQCHQDWGVFWSSSISSCDAWPGKMRWTYWTSAYVYSNFLMTYLAGVPFVSFSVGHHMQAQLNALNGHIAWTF